jgi:creatinine deaminase
MQSLKNNMYMAIDAALRSETDGGIPIGASLVDHHGFLVSNAGSEELQLKSFIHHAVVKCIELANRQGFTQWNNSTLYTTTAPCTMCCGAILMHGISNVIVGETSNQIGNLDILRGSGVIVGILHSEQCKNLLTTFIDEKPFLWKSKKVH